MFLAYRKGFILSLFVLVSWVVSLFLAFIIYPFVTNFLWNINWISSGITGFISKNIDLSSITQLDTLKAQTDWISSLPLPSFLTDTLLANNNPEFYKLINVDNVHDYMAGALGRLIIDIISLILVFIIVMIIMRIIAQCLNLVSKLPIINSINRLFGLAFGFVQGTIIIWLLLIILICFVSNKEFAQIFQQLQSSSIAIIFHENNLLRTLILGT